MFALCLHSILHVVTVIKLGTRQSVTLLLHHLHIMQSFQENPLANVKKIDCALLPPSHTSLKMKLLRAQYVTILWMSASSAYPTDGMSPTDYGWLLQDGILQPHWFDGPAIPESVFTNDNDADANVVHNEPDVDADSSADESDAEAWTSDDDDTSSDSDEN